MNIRIILNNFSVFICIYIYINIQNNLCKKIVNKFQTIPFTDRYLKIFDVNYKPIINNFVSQGVVKDYPPQLTIK